VSQFAQNNLTLEFERDHEEEQRHQAVIDPVTKRSSECKVAEVQAKLNLPERCERRGPSGIRQNERRDGRDEQHDGCGDLDLEKSRKGSRQSVGDLGGKIFSRLTLQLQPACCAWFIGGPMLRRRSSMAVLRVRCAECAARR
jgi:hypothetical protein